MGGFLGKMRPHLANPYEQWGKLLENRGKKFNHVVEGDDAADSLKVRHALSF